MRVFVVEDDPIILTGFSMMLKALGHEVVGQAVDGVSAVEKALALQPELILMDINMPKMDGISAIEKINQKNVIPCIIITGYKDEKQIERAARAGVYGYLCKPVDEYALKGEIAVVAERVKVYQSVERDRDKAIHSLEERKLIEQAKGILMKQKNLSEIDAFREMQKKSRDQNLKLADLARKIIKAYAFCAGVL